MVSQGRNRKQQQIIYEAYKDNALTTAQLLCVLRITTFLYNQRRCQENSSGGKLQLEGPTLPLPPLFLPSPVLPLPLSSPRLPYLPLSFIPLSPLPLPLRSRPPKIQLGDLGERCKLPQRGLGRSPSRQTIWCILALKSDIWWQQF